MATLKESLEELLEETSELHSTAEHQVRASEGFVEQLSTLREEISEAQSRFDRLEVQRQQELFDNFKEVKTSIERAFKDAADQIARGLLISSIVGPMIAHATEQRGEDPAYKMAKRYNDLFYIVQQALNSGELLDYEGILNLLVIHEFDRKQAEFMLDRLINKYEALAEFTSDDGTTYLAFDTESELVKQVNASYAAKQLIYIP
jgi:hypothetical protein